jgi:hypothetical protein
VQLIFPRHLAAAMTASGSKGLTGKHATWANSQWVGLKSLLFSGGCQGDSPEAALSCKCNQKECVRRNFN